MTGNTQCARRVDSNTQSAPSWMLAPRNTPASWISMSSVALVAASRPLERSETWPSMSWPSIPVPPDASTTARSTGLSMRNCRPVELLPV
jgi:hypothetical protein